RHRGRGAGRGGPRAGRGGAARGRSRPARGDPRRAGGVPRRGGGGDRREGARDLPDHRAGGPALRRPSGGPRVPVGADAIGRRARMFTVEDVVRGSQGALVGGDLAIPVSGVAIATRTLGGGGASVALH